SPDMGAPIPWQHFMKPYLREAGNPGEHVGEPGLRIDVVEPGGHDQGRDGGGTLGTTIGTGEQPGLSAQGKAPQRAFVVVTISWNHSGRMGRWSTGLEGRTQTWRRI